MIGKYGGEYYEDCNCGGRVTINQHINCACDKCKTVTPEVFEYYCNSCCNYGLSDRFTVQDPENDCSYLWLDIGYPLAEIDDVGEFKNRVSAQMQRKLTQTENSFRN